MKPDTWWISPHFRQGDFPEGPTDDQKIAIFADRVRGWMLDPAERLLHLDPHSGFAALAILSTYFEMITKYQDGRTDRSGSGENFRRGVVDVLSTLGPPTPITAEIAGVVYEGLRNGLYHGGFPTSAIAVQAHDPAALQYDPNSGTVMLNPRQILHAVQRHFSSYIAQLNDGDNTERRENFLARFNADTGG